ncbi:uncharacterized protein UTRI_06345 [Ustilago trichophora]|uniref:RING-type domain-containing protein n=1 Tax=Ustilago trichophora TaxID=86804 RepID=A0A5C3EK37_9BASI|nr:uncharacterized protein UTRI_06345 [Ustilago trichophora]
MGNSQSRQQRDANSRRDRPSGLISPAASPQSSENGSNQDANAASSNESGARRRKRRRDSTSAAPLTDSTVEHRPLSQRRRTSLHSRPASDSPSRNAPTSFASHRSSTVTADDAMDVDPPQALSLPTTTAATATLPTEAHAQSDLQQRYAAVQSTNDTASAVGHGATPPPQLDALREERERARRQILETLGIMPSATASSQEQEQATAPTANASTSAPLPASGSDAQPVPMSSTIAALLGAMATGRASPDTAAPHPGSGTTPPAPSSHAAPASAATSQSGARQQQQQRPQTARPQPIRIPLQPEMISGTSMVVQGALVARTVPNRPTSSSSHESTQGNAQQASTSETRPSTTTVDSSEAASAGAQNYPGVPGATLEGDNLRGAVTLEEQAVMLSRILGIAAAATAASLLNTSEANNVDPSLLQTSLRRPFERMNQAPADRNERWLADWQQRPHPSASGTQASGGTASGLGNGLRGRLSALSRRVSSTTSSSGPPVPQPNGNTASSATDASGRPDSASDATDTNAAHALTAEEQAARQQEIIAHLLSAAEREAASQRLSRTRTAEQPSTPSAAVETARARSSSFSSSQSQTNTSATQQDAPRSSLSRLVRSTIGSLMHPSRILPTRNSRSDGAQSGSSARDGWPVGNATASGASGSARASSSSEFSLGPNDVAGTLRQVRNGILPDGVPGSFGSFLNHLVCDLMAAVQLMRPSSEVPLERAEAQTTNYFEHAASGEATSGAEVLDGDTAEPAAAAADANSGSDTSQAQSQQAEASTSTSSGEEDVETQARRDRDFQNGNLSFFRLFRFDPVAPSQLVPCIVVGVRSLNVTERFGEDMVAARAPGPGREFNGSRQQTSRPTTLGSTRPTDPLPRQRAQSEGPQASASPADGTAAESNGEELPASRFMLFVSGGRYPPNHPLLTSNPATAGRDLMILLDLLSTIQAMQHKPSTVTQQEIDASDLVKIKGSEVAGLVREGKITENMAERCLVCLEDWKDEDECRVLACRHAFHTVCVDRWMSSSSNTCPMCRRQGVSKDGRRAGEETADSRRAAQG